MNALLNANISTQNLANYEQQAVQKMQDLLDYITIIGSSKYNKNMREVALESVLADFDKKAKINCDWIDQLDAATPSKEHKKGEIPNCQPQKMLKDLLEANHYETQVSYQNVTVSDGLILQLDGTYTGTLQYELAFKIKASEQNDFRNFLKKLGKMDFVLKRIQKKFGNEKAVVWEVKFMGMTY